MVLEVTIRVLFEEKDGDGVTNPSIIHSAKVGSSDVRALSVCSEM